MEESAHTINMPSFDADGFMVEPEGWSETLANRLASQEGLVALTPEQLELLHSLRDEYQKSGGLPAQSHICHLGSQEPDCLQQLFASPLQAWRLAGLPNPGEEAKAYMSNK